MSKRPLSSREYFPDPSRPTNATVNHIDKLQPILGRVPQIGDVFNGLVKDYGQGPAIAFALPFMFAMAMPDFPGSMDGMEYQGRSNTTDGASLHGGGSHRDIQPYDTFGQMPVRARVERRPQQGAGESYFSPGMGWGELPTVIKPIPFQNQIDDVRYAVTEAAVKQGVVVDTAKIVPLGVERNYAMLQMQEGRRHDPSENQYGVFAIGIDQATGAPFIASGENGDGRVIMDGNQQYPWKVDLLSLGNDTVTDDGRRIVIWNAEVGGKVKPAIEVIYAQNGKVTVNLIVTEKNGNSRKLVMREAVMDGGETPIEDEQVLTALIKGEVGQPGPVTGVEMSIDEIREMSDEAKLAAAPTIDEARERIPAGVAWTIESQEIVGERGIVYYDADGRQRAAYDLLTGEMYDGMSIYQYDKAMDPITAFLMNDSEALKEIPEKYFLKGQEHLLGEAIFAVLAINWAYPALVNKEMLEHNSKYGLSGVDAQWDFYNEKIKPAFIAALKDGSALKKGIMVEGKAIKDKLPTFVLVRGRDDEQEMYLGENLKPWVFAEHEKDVFTILMSPPKGVYSEWVPIMLGGELSNLKGLIVNALGGVGGRGYAADFAKIITMILLGGKKVPAGKMNNSQYGTSSSEDRMPNVYPNLPEGYYGQGIDK